MAGGRNHHPKYHHKPSNATASTASSYRSNTAATNNKSRFEATSAAPRSSDPKPGQKPAPTKPSPKTGPSPSPARPRPPAGPNSPAPPRGTPSRPLPDPTALGPPPPPSYGFHMLDRRTIVLADGSVRSYFALPPDYQDFLPSLPPRPLDPSAAAAGRFLPGAPRPEFGGLPGPDAFRGGREELFVRGRQPQDYWNSLGLDSGRLGPAEGPSKRKFWGEGEERDRVDDEQDKARKRQQVLQYGNPDRYPGPGPGPGGSFAGPSGEVFRGSKYGSALESVRLKHQDVDQAKLKKAFLYFVKLTNENAFHRRNYLDNGKNGSLKCVACGRSSKEFQDVHGLIMHSYNFENADLHVEHLGLHKALCALMGWNYAKPPDNSKAYQFLPAEEAAANLEDLIMWPPVVIIHNTITGKSKEGRMEGLGVKAMDNYVRELGFMGGKSKSLYGREGRLGITLIKFAANHSGLKEASQLAEHFEKDNHGRKGWARLQPLTLGKDDENNPNLVRVDGRTGEKRRIFYGYLGTALDMDKLDFDTRKKVVFESKRECLSSS